MCARHYQFALAPNVIKGGALLASGNAEEIYANELVRKYYLGEHFKA